MNPLRGLAYFFSAIMGDWTNTVLDTRAVFVGENNMKWAIEIKQTGLEQRNLVDLMKGLGFSKVEGVSSPVKRTDHK